MKKKFIAVLALTIVFGASAYAEKLADTDTMQKQLESVTDDDYLAENYFPLILKHAGSEKAPMGIVMMFAFANYDYSSKVLKGMPDMVQVVAQMHLDSLVPQFIKAILPDHAEETIKAWEEACDLHDGA